MVFIQGIAKININIALDLHLFGECCAGAGVAENCRKGSPWDGGSEKRWMGWSGRESCESQSGH